MKRSLAPNNGESQDFNTKDQQLGRNQFQKKFDDFLGSVGELLNDFTALEVNTIVATEITGAKFNPWEAYQSIYSISDKDYFTVKKIPEQLQGRYTKLFEKLERDYFNLLIDKKSEFYNPIDEKVIRYRLNIFLKRVREDFNQFNKLKPQEVEKILTKIQEDFNQLQNKILLELNNQENEANQEIQRLRQIQNTINNPEEIDKKIKFEVDKRTQINNNRIKIQQANLYKVLEHSSTSSDRASLNDDSKIELDPENLSEIRPILPDPVNINDLESSWEEMCKLLDNSAFLRSLRKIIELKAALDSTNPASSSIDIIYAQTIVQLDGDIITRFHNNLFKHNKEKQDLILKVHNEGVTAGNEQWHSLLEFIVNLGQGAIALGRR